jgi:phosphate transport system permease protein
MANALLGTVFLVLLAGAIGIPIAVGAGVFLAEGRTLAPRERRAFHRRRDERDPLDRGRHLRVGLGRRLDGTLLDARGGIALAVMLIPMVTRTTEEMVRLVPRELREGGIASASPAGARRSASCFRPRGAGS